MNLEPLLSEAELSEWTGLNRSTLRGYRDQSYDPMPCYRTSSGTLRYDRAKVMAWLERQAGTAMRLNGNHVSIKTIEAALVKTIDAGAAERGYHEDQLQLADDTFRSGLTLGEILANAARMPSHRDIGGIFREIQAGTAGVSTTELGDLLSNVANKLLRDGFMSVEQEWANVAAIGSVTDFKETPRFSLTGDFKFERVGNGGEIKHATMGAEAYGNKADTMARLFTLSRQDLINDDAGAFTRIKQLLGRGAALSLNELFWTEFLRQVSTFWSAANGNELSGAASALDIDSLTRAEQTLADMLDPDGNPMGLQPAILLVATSNKVLANRLCNDSQLAISGNTDRIITTSNPFAGRLRPVASTYLSTPKIPNSSPLHWWLMADPMDCPAIEVVFLNGRREPIIESSELLFNQLGIAFRGYFDLGVRLQEKRASVRSVGA